MVKGVSTNHSIQQKTQHTITYAHTYGHHQRDKNCKAPATWKTSAPDKKWQN